MRYTAPEKLEIIRLVEQSHLSVRRSLVKTGIPPTTFYRWYDRFVEHGLKRLEDRSSRPSRVWNRIPEAVRDQIVPLALVEPERSPRELAVRQARCGKPILPISRSSVRAGFNCPRSLRTSPTTSSAGNSAAVCGLKMSPTRSTSRLPHHAATAPRFSTNRVCSATMARPISLPIWRNTSKTKA